MSEKQGRGEVEAGQCSQGTGPGPGGGGVWGWGLPGSDCRAAWARRAATGHMGPPGTENAAGPNGDVPWSVEKTRDSDNFIQKNINY